MANEYRGQDEFAALHYRENDPTSAYTQTRKAVDGYVQFEVHGAFREMSNVSDELWMTTAEVLKLATSRAREPV